MSTLQSALDQILQEGEYSDTLVESLEGRLDPPEAIATIVLNLPFFPGLLTPHGERGTGRMLLLPAAQCCGNGRMS